MWDVEVTNALFLPWHCPDYWGSVVNNVAIVLLVRTLENGLVYSISLSYKLKFFLKQAISVEKGHR